MNIKNKGNYGKRTPESQWRTLRNDLNLKLNSGLRNPAFIFSFLGVIVFAGSIGIWLPYIFDKTDKLFKPEALLTYGLTILASILSDTLLSKDEILPNHKMLGYFVGIIAIMLLLAGYFDNFTLKSVMGVSLVLLIWFFANEQDNKYDKTYSKGPLGGDDVVEGTCLQGGGLDSLADGRKKDGIEAHILSQENDSMEDIVLQGEGVK